MPMTMINDDTRPGSSDRWRWFTHETPTLRTLRVAPADLVHPGDEVQIADDSLAYQIKRVGYRLTPNDMRGAAHALMRQEEVHSALLALCKHTGARPHGRFADKFEDALRVGLAIGQRYGGGDRGMWGYQPSHRVDEVRVVLSKRVVRLGERQRAVGSGEDYEGPRLVNGLSVVLLNLDGWGEIPAAWVRVVVVKRRKP